VYIIYQHQLHISANAAVAIFRLDTILSEKLYRYDIILKQIISINVGKGERDLVWACVQMVKN